MGEGLDEISRLRRYSVYLQRSSSRYLQSTNAALICADEAMRTLSYNTHLYNAVQHYLLRRPDRSFVSCLSSLISSSSSSSSSSSLHPSASRFSPRIPKLRKKPSNEIPAKSPKGSASPLGWILVAAVKSDPEMKGPAARPAAESVWAKPLRVPSTL